MAINVFISYAHAGSDERAYEELVRHLHSLEENKRIRIWSRKLLTAGQDQLGELNAALDKADLVLLLISIEFFNDDACDKEMKRATERHRAGRAHVVPVIIDYVDWRDPTIDDLKKLPTDGRPVSSWEPTHKAWIDVVRGIEQIVNEKLWGISPTPPRSKKSYIEEHEGYAFAESARPPPLPEISPSAPPAPLGLPAPSTNPKLNATSGKKRRTLLYTFVVLLAISFGIFVGIFSDWFPPAPRRPIAEPVATPTTPSSPTPATRPTPPIEPSPSCPPRVEKCTHKNGKLDTATIPVSLHNIKPGQTQTILDIYGFPEHALLKATLYMRVTQGETNAWQEISWKFLNNKSPPIKMSQRNQQCSETECEFKLYPEKPDSLSLSLQAPSPLGAAKAELTSIQCNKGDIRRDIGCTKAEGSLIVEVLN